MPALAAQAVGGNGDVDLLWIGQVQRGHNLDELIHGLSGQPRVALALLADGADVAVMIIVRRVDQAIVGQGEQLFGDRTVQRLRVASLEIGSAGAVDQQRVAGERP